MDDNEIGVFLGISSVFAILYQVRYVYHRVSCFEGPYILWISYKFCEICFTEKP